MRLINELPEPTSIHWHGVRLPDAMDGVPHLVQPPVVPGASFDYVFRPPDAGTFWYHAHRPRPGRSRPVWRPDRRGAGSLRNRSRCSAGSRNARRGRRLVIATRSRQRIGASRSPGDGRRAIAPATDQRDQRARFASPARGPFAVGHGARRPAGRTVRARDGRVALGPGGRVDLFVDTMQNPGTVAAILAGLREEQPIARLLLRTHWGPAQSRRARTRCRCRPIRCLPASI